MSASKSMEATKLQYTSQQQQYSRSKVIAAAVLVLSLSAISFGIFLHYNKMYKFKGISNSMYTAQINHKLYTTKKIVMLLVGGGVTGVFVSCFIILCAKAAVKKAQTAVAEAKRLQEKEARKAQKAETKRLQDEAQRDKEAAETKKLQEEEARRAQEAAEAKRLQEEEARRVQEEAEARKVQAVHTRCQVIESEVASLLSKQAKLKNGLREGWYAIEGEMNSPRSGARKGAIITYLLKKPEEYEIQSRVRTEDLLKLGFKQEVGSNNKSKLSSPKVKGSKTKLAYKYFQSTNERDTMAKKCNAGLAKIKELQAQIDALEQEKTTLKASLVKQ